MMRLVERARAVVEQHESATKARTRRRKEKDAENFGNAVDVMVSNLAHAVLMPPESGRLAFATGNPLKGQSRYDNPALGKPVSGLLYSLEACGMLTHYPSATRGEASSFAPTGAFAHTVRAAGVTLSDFGKMPGEETIILSRKSRKGGPELPGSYRERVIYPDQPGANALRREVATLNAFVSAADIAFMDDGHGPIDPHERLARRYFTMTDADQEPRFDQCGRLYGGFWQNLNRRRRPGIRVAGEAVAVLDFASMFTRLAYAHVGEVPPPGDLYAIAGLEQRRPIVKKAFSTLLFDNFARPRWPVEFVEDENGTDPATFLPREWTVALFRRAVLDRHPALKPCFGKGLGYGLMFQESCILIRALDEMRTRGIIGLGLHDGMLVPVSRAEQAARIMVEAGREITGTILPVGITC